VGRVEKFLMQTSGPSCLGLIIPIMEKIIQPKNLGGTLSGALLGHDPGAPGRYSRSITSRDEH
jgi:hypothetical protein